MKFIYGAEDTVIGIICGLLIIGLTGRFFSLKLPNAVYAIAFAIFIVFIVLDLISEFSDLSAHPFFIISSILHNIVDFALSLGFISYFTNWSIPYITLIIVPYLQNETMLFAAGIFLVIGNAIWIVIYPFVY